MYLKFWGYVLGLWNFRENQSQPVRIHCGFTSLASFSPSWQLFEEYRCHVHVSKHLNKPGGTPFRKPYRYYMCCPKGMVFVLFRSKNRYWLCQLFWSGIRYGFWGNYGNKEQRVYEFKMDFKKSFCWCSNVVCECIYHKRLSFLEKQDRGTRIRDWGPIHDNFLPFL